MPNMNMMLKTYSKSCEGIFQETSKFSRSDGTVQRSLFLEDSIGIDSKRY